MLRLAVGRDEDFLWAATTSPNVHKWAIGSSGGSGAAEAAAGPPLTPRSPLGGGGTGSSGGSCFIASPSPAMRARLAFDLHGACTVTLHGVAAAAPPGTVNRASGACKGPVPALLWPSSAPDQALPSTCASAPCAAGTRPPPQQLQPVAATPGLPPIQHVAVLTDRRHVLTQDAEGRVLMWDVSAGKFWPASPLLLLAGRRAGLAATACPDRPRLFALHLLLCCLAAAAGAVVRDYGQCDLKEVEQSLFQPSHSVSAWFAPEVKLGSLAGSMEVPGCFGAEIYAQVGGAAPCVAATLLVRRGPAHPAWPGCPCALGCHAGCLRGMAARQRDGGCRLLE